MCFHFSITLPLYLHLILPIQPFYIFITGVGNAKTIPVPSEAAALNHKTAIKTTKITFTLCFRTNLTCSPQQLFEAFDWNSHVPINVITRLHMIHESTSRASLPIELISIIHHFSFNLDNRSRCAGLEIFHAFLFHLPSWREYSRSKVTSHMP